MAKKKKMRHFSAEITPLAVARSQQ